MIMLQIEDGIQRKNGPNLGAFTQNMSSSKDDLGEYVEFILNNYKLNNRVLLVQVPQFLFESFNLDIVKSRGFYAYPPTGLQCIKKALSNRGLKIDILDLNFLLLKRLQDDDTFDYLNWLDILDEYLKDNDPSIIGVGGISVSTDVSNPLFHYTALLKHLRSLNRHVLIAGGTIATNECDYYLLNELCHFVIEGEGENKINHLFDCLFKKGIKHNATSGIYFNNQGELIESKGHDDDVVLKETLIETYHALPIEAYHEVGSLNPFSRMVGIDRPFSTIQLNRGCRANCKFCDVQNFMGSGLRQYPLKDLLEEMQYLIAERRIKHFEILDDDFLGTPSFKTSLVELLHGLVAFKKKYDITWSAGNGLIASSLTEQLLQLIRDSGCVGFRIGIESGNSDMLKKMRKPTSLKIINRVGDLLKGFPEIFVGGNYIIGLFGEETFGQMLDTFRLTFNVKLDWASYTTFQFTSKTNATVEKLNKGDKFATEFVPSRNSLSRETPDDMNVVSGPNIFELPRDQVPSREQVNHIWFTFNLVSNYINNHNLKPGGHPEKLKRWLEAVQICYPDNPYMPFFTALCYVLQKDNTAAQRYLERTKMNLQDSSYWQHRFDQFDLTQLVNHFPNNVARVYADLDFLQEKYKMLSEER
jgi:radical SAM superfamily enzyme YgiQ (UPF0313 family)